MKLSTIIKQNQAFLQETPEVYFSPGRVNLIGEYIDFLGGSVFPASINLGTYAFVTKRNDQELHQTRNCRSRRWRCALLTTIRSTHNLLKNIATIT